MNQAKIFGAQNLSGWPQFPPGHRALGLQKLPLVRFRICAWLLPSRCSWCWAAGRDDLGAPRMRAGQCPAPTKYKAP